VWTEIIRQKFVPNTGETVAECRSSTWSNTASVFFILYCVMFRNILFILCQ